MKGSPFDEQTAVVLAVLAPAGRSIGPEALVDGECQAKNSLQLSVVVRSFTRD